MRPISDEKRELIIEAKQRGEKEEAIALWLKVSKASVGTIWKHYRRRGNFLPISYKGRQSILTQTEIDKIVGAIKQTPDMTLSELIEKLSLPIKKSQLSRLLIRLGYSVKKRRYIQKTSSERMSSRNA
jgi:transposase